MELNGGGLEEFEQVVVRRGPRSGLEMVVAIHSTALGPALGGVRLWHYDSTEDGIADALRLARGMTYKAAASGLDLGGGKGVICARSPEPPAGAEREALLLDFGDLVESLGGRYITAEDVGISPADLVAIRSRTRHVTGLPPEHGGSGDPSPFTALGVEVAIRACVRERTGTSDLRGLHAVIVGVGHVGEKLARRLAAAGARLTLSDIAPARRALAAELGSGWAEPGAAMLAECDVLAPCALGGAINRANAGRLRCRIVCGSANNQLEDDSLAAELARRGVLYAPDFIVNAGGLIHVYKELRGYSEERARQLVLGIEDALDRILLHARQTGATPLAAAYELARQRLAAAEMLTGATA